MGGRCCHAPTCMPCVLGQGPRAQFTEGHMGGNTLTDTRTGVGGSVSSFGSQRTGTLKPLLARQWAAKGKARARKAKERTDEGDGGEAGRQDASDGPPQVVPGGGVVPRPVCCVRPASRIARPVPPPLSPFFAPISLARPPARQLRPLNDNLSLVFIPLLLIMLWISLLLRMLLFTILIVLLLILL